MDWIKLLKNSKSVVKAIWECIKKQKATTLIIAVLIAIIFFMRVCDKPEIVIDYQDVLIHDTIVEVKDTTIYVDSIVEKLVPYKIIEHDTIWLTQEVDTGAILSAYFEEKFYNDTLSNDTILFAVSRYKVSQNELERQSFKYTINRPQTISHNTTITNPPKNKLYLDLGLGGNLNTFDAYTGLQFIDKRDRGYSAGYNWISKTVEVGMQFKLLQYGKSK